MQLPEYVENLINILHAEGEEAYAVGGCVRDMIMGREPNDYDMTTSAPPERTQEIFEGAGFRTIPTGIKHGTVTVIADANHVEITTFRIDGDYNDSRHPDSVTFTRRVEDDLSRRDFTVNAMAYNEKDGTVDVFGGREDIEKRIIRAVGEPQRRFHEDALRILRAVRFSATLGFEIESATLAAMESEKNGLLAVSRERIRVEFEKTLVCERAAYGIDLMARTGILSVIFPCLDAQLVAELAEKIALLPPDFEVRLAFLLSKSDDEATKNTLFSLKLSANSHKKILLMLEAAKRELPDISSGYSIRKYLQRFKSNASEAARVRALLEGVDASDIIRALESEAEKSPALFIPDLKISGADLIMYGITDGLSIGGVLYSLIEAVIENPELNEKEKLMALAIDFSKRSK